MMIKVNVNVQVELNISLNKDDIDKISSMAPGMALTKYDDKEYKGTDYLKIDLEYDSMAEMIAMIDKNIDGYAKDYITSKFGNRVAIMDNYISLSSYSFVIEKISGFSN